MICKRLNETISENVMEEQDKEIVFNLGTIEWYAEFQLETTAQHEVLLFAITPAWLGMFTRIKFLKRNVVKQFLIFEVVSLQQIV